MNLKWPQEQELKIFHILGEVPKVPKDRIFRTKKGLSKQKHRGMLVYIQVALTKPCIPKGIQRHISTKVMSKTKPELLGV